MLGVSGRTEYEVHAFPFRENDGGPLTLPVLAGQPEILPGAIWVAR